MMRMGLTQLCRSEKKHMGVAYLQCGEASGLWTGLGLTFILATFHWTSHQSPSEMGMGSAAVRQPEVCITASTVRGPFNVADIPSLCPNFGGVRAVAGQKNK